MTKIKKAIIPAAGKGTRLEPLTRAIPKEMIRVGRKPVIHHIVDMLREAGVEEILIIIGWKKGSILDYFGSGKEFGVDITYRIQDKQIGLGDAVLQGKKWTNEEDFIVVYGDNYIKDKKAIQELITQHNKNNADCSLLLQPVDNPERFGIVKLDDKNNAIKMIEKPTLKVAEDYKTNGEFLNIAGIGIYKPKIFEFIEKTPPGKGDEIQITDSIELMRKEGHTVQGTIFRGDRFDIGTWDSIERADKLEMESGDKK